MRHDNKIGVSEAAIAGAICLGLLSYSCPVRAATLGDALDSETTSPVPAAPASAESSEQPAAAVAPATAAVPPAAAAAPATTTAPPATAAAPAGTTATSAPPPTNATAASTPTAGPGEVPDVMKQKVQVVTKPAFPIAGAVSRNIQRYTGLNLLSGLIASHVAKVVLQHKFGGKVKIKIKTFSLTDLLAGKIKAVQCTLSGCSVKGLRLGDVMAQAQNPIWYNYKRKGGQKPGLKSPIMVAVKASMSQKDVSKALECSEVASHLAGLHLDLPGLGSQQLQVIKPKVEIIGDSVRIEAVLITAGAKPETGVPIIISGKMRLDADNRIMLDDMHVISDSIVEPEKFAAFTQELINPLLDFRKLDRRDHAFRLKALYTGASKVQGDGTLLLVPKTCDAMLAGQRSTSK